MSNTREALDSVPNSTEGAGEHDLRLTDSIAKVMIYHCGVCVRVQRSNKKEVKMDRDIKGPSRNATSDESSILGSNPAGHPGL